jgi:hypothetical protein
MVVAKKTWKEKRIEKEDECGSSDIEATVVSSSESQRLDINMVFQLSQEFMLPEQEMAHLTLGAERAIFEKPETLGQHMKLLYIWGHLDAILMNQMLVDGSACVNIMPGSVFEKIGHKDEELLMTNMMLSGFSGKARDAKGIISKELMVGSKSVPTVFFMVNVTGKYNSIISCYGETRYT